MRLRAFVRRHDNVFSASNRWVDAGPEDVDMLEEEYGDRAVAGRRFNSFTSWRRLLGGFGWVNWFSGSAPSNAVDGILEIGDDSAEDENPPPTRTP